MSEASVAQSTSQAVDADTGTETARDRRSFRTVAALTILPIVIGAILAGLGGWIPTNDGASTVLRAKYAIGSDPSLVGMFAYMSSTWAQTPTYFPGPWQLWWMSIPIRVLGTGWGTLLSMAVLNSLWFLLAGWLTKRRFGVGVGSAVMIFLALLVWSLGLQTTRTSVPMVAVMLVYAVFLFLAWTVSTGDERVLPWIALSANYLVLNHLQLTRLVPVIGLAAVSSWIVVIVRERRVGGEAWRDKKRRSLRAWAIAWGVTVVMWTPTIVQQFTSSNGNLTNLGRAASASRLDPLARLSGAFPYATQLYSQPHLWLRGSVSRIGDLPSTQATVVATIVLALLTFGLGYVSFRRRDRSAFCAVGLAAVVYFATWYNFAGTPFGLYVLPLWPNAMFVTFALGFALVRAVPGPVLRGVRLDARLGAVGVAAVVSVLTFTTTQNPVANMGSPDQREASRLINRAVIDAVQGHGTVRLEEGEKMFPYASALAVALNDAGVPFCHADILSLQKSVVPECGERKTDVVISIDPAASRPLGSTSRVIARTTGRPQTVFPSEVQVPIVVTMSVPRPGH